MRVQNYKQFDPAWHMMIGRGTMTMAQGGCGINATANIVGKNPVEVGTWMEQQGFIWPNEGTVHEGIVLTLRHYGIDSEYVTTEYLNGQMASPYFNRLYDHVYGGFCAILLVGGLLTRTPRPCRNSYFSNAGHYDTICGARDGKLLMHDPASYARDGYHSIVDVEGRLEDSFNGNIKKIVLIDYSWKEGNGDMVEIPAVRLGSRGKHVKTLQVLLNKAGFKGTDGRSLKEDGDAGTNTIFAINSYQTVRRAQGKELGTNGKNDSSCGKAMWSDLIIG